MFCAHTYRLCNPFRYFGTFSAAKRHFIPHIYRNADYYREGPEHLLVLYPGIVILWGRAKMSIKSFILQQSSAFMTVAPTSAPRCSAQNADGAFVASDNLQRCRQRCETPKHECNKVSSPACSRVETATAQSAGCIQVCYFDMVTLTLHTINQIVIICFWIYIYIFCPFQSEKNKTWISLLQR